MRVRTASRSELDEAPEPLPLDPAFPGRRRPAGWYIRATGRCRACGAPISWAITPTGRAAPLDPDGISHFATCPDAETFRRIRGTRPPGAS